MIITKLLKIKKNVYLHKHFEGVYFVVVTTSKDLVDLVLFTALAQLFI